MTDGISEQDLDVLKMSPGLAELVDKVVAAAKKPVKTSAAQPVPVSQTQADLEVMRNYLGDTRALDTALYGRRDLVNRPVTRPTVPTPPDEYELEGVVYNMSAALSGHRHSDGEVSLELTRLINQLKAKYSFKDTMDVGPIILGTSAARRLSGMYGLPEEKVFEEGLFPDHIVRRSLVGEGVKDPQPVQVDMRRNQLITTARSLRM